MYIRRMQIPQRHGLQKLSSSSSTLRTRIADVACNAESPDSSWLALPRNRIASDLDTAHANALSSTRGESSVVCKRRLDHDLHEVQNANLHGRAGLRARGN